MKAPVEDFLKYLDGQSAPLAGTVTLTRLEWGADGWESEADNQVTVWVDRAGEPAVDIRGVASAKGQAAENVADLPRAGRLDEPVHLRVKVWCYTGNFWVNDRSQGEGEADTTLRGLLEGIEVPLDRYDNRAYFRLTGGQPPAEPPLPAYQD